MEVQDESIGWRKNSSLKNTGAHEEKKIRWVFSIWPKTICKINACFHRFSCDLVAA